MTVIFVAAETDIDKFVWGKDKLESFTETHNPLMGFEDFCQAWHPIDRLGYKSCSETFRMTDLDKRFWDRHEFLDFLRSGSDDVYVQSPSTYSVNLVFVSEDDHFAFNETLLTNHREWFSFDDTLKDSIFHWLADNNVEPSHYRTRITKTNTIDFKFRNPVDAMLVQTKFVFTTPEDHTTEILF